MNTFDPKAKVSPRPGSERDVLKLKRLFEELNFIVTVECNLNEKELKDVIYLFSQNEKHREYSCCFVFLFSHGAPMHSGSIDGQWGIVCRDGNKIDVEKDVINKFSNQEAQHLIGKPKFIIINACRGDSPDYANMPKYQSGDVGESIIWEAQGAYPVEPYRSVADMAIVKSSVPGYASLRDSSRGTWFIEELCEVFRSNACNQDVLTLFDLTDKALSRRIGPEGQVQTLEVTKRGMNKKLFLYPGL
ncbi:caspase Dronc-like [Artemia franciscana]|uniref:caspase Dronc-like n=1 Tax=Artemia franciscana TaxID=6661 RepID=UPI0032DA0614